MSFETFIARRYLSTRKKPVFVSFLLIISLTAVTIGVFALIFVLSVMNGFERDVRKKVLSFSAPVIVWSREGADLSDESADWKKLDPRIERVVAFAEGEAVARTSDDSLSGVRVRGILEQPTEERLGKYYESEPFGDGSLVMGEELADTLRVFPERSEKIRLIFPIGDVGPAGDLIPKVREFTVTGAFHSGYYDFDSKYVVVPYLEALRLFGSEARTGLEVWLTSPDEADAVKRALLAKKGSEAVSVRTWRDQNPKLFAAMKLEKIGMFVLLGMLLLISSFNVFGITSLTVLDKVKDMAVLRSVGLTARRIRRIFLLNAAGIGGLGAFFGGGLGLTATWLLKRFPVKLPETYYLETLPVVVDPRDVAVILLLVPLVTTIAAFYPALKASRLSPVETLRYE